MNQSKEPADTRLAQMDSVLRPAREHRAKEIRSATAAFMGRRRPFPAGLYAARIRLVAVFTMTFALMLGALSFAGQARAATIDNASCSASGYAQIDGKCMHIKHTKALGPAASAALNEALATSAGRAALQKAFQSLKGAKAGAVQTSPAYAGPDAFMHPDWNCPGGASCGVSRSGGWHFWVIVSYAAVYNVGAFPFWLACTGALSPIIDPVAATAACGAVTGVIWALVNNAPWTTRHGIWLAVYWNHISDGYW
jgi:hypothetical protein